MFKSELREALKDPGQLPGDELFESVEYEHGSDEAFLRWLWHVLYGDEPFDACIVTRLKALPEPFADRLDWVHSRARFGVGKAARAGDWAQALDVLLGMLVKSGPRSARPTATSWRPCSRRPGGLPALRPAHFRVAGRRHPRATVDVRCVLPEPG